MEIYKIYSAVSKTSHRYISAETKKEALKIFIDSVDDFWFDDIHIIRICDFNEIIKQ